MMEDSKVCLLIFYRLGFIVVVEKKKLLWERKREKEKVFSFGLFSLD